jgi:hypothetical protein
MVTVDRHKGVSSPLGGVLGAQNKERARSTQKLFNMRTLFSTFYHQIFFALPQQSYLLCLYLLWPICRCPRGYGTLPPAAKGWLDPYNLSLIFSALGPLPTPLHLSNDQCTEQSTSSMGFLKALTQTVGKPRDILVLCPIAQSME